MRGIEISYANVCINALIRAYCQLLHTSAKEALEKSRYGKADTKGFDALIESIIKKRLHEYDDEIVLITEETDQTTSRTWPIDPDPTQQPKMFFSDPVDRSKYFEKLVMEMTKGDDIKHVKIGELLARSDVVDIWESVVGDSPASITGATAAITYVNRGHIVFSIVLNFITREIFVACGMGIRKILLPSDLGGTDYTRLLEYMMSHGEKINFRSAQDDFVHEDDHNRFVTFLGKSMYAEIFEESHILTGDYEKFLHHREPGGPSRVLYLSDIQTVDTPIGFVIGNGEKIGEWIHWLSFVKFAKNKQGNPALRAYEISLKKALFKDEVLVSTPKAYSIFNCDNDRSYIDVSRIKNHECPSRFRSIIVIAPWDNERITPIMDRHEYRDIGKCL